MILDLTWKKCEFENFPEISMELKPLTFRAYQTIIGLLAEIGIGNEASKVFGRVDIGSAIEEIFPNHVRNIQGIQIKEDENVRNIEATDFASFGALANLCMEVLAKLLEISKLGEEDEKKSEALPED